jgi:hypothetical protein
VPGVLLSRVTFGSWFELARLGGIPVRILADCGGLKFESGPDVEGILGILLS